MFSIKVKVKNEGDNDSAAWEEELSVNSKDTAKKEIQEILKDFNKYQKGLYGKKARKRVIVNINIPGEGEEKYYCDFHKDNLVSNADGSDTYKCKKCGRKTKRSSLDWRPPKIVCKVQPEKPVKKRKIKFKKIKKKIK